MYSNIQKRLLQSILKTDFVSFLHKVFNTVNPSSKFTHNWHIDLISDILSACIQSDGPKRIIINIPPRCLKSVCISVAWPAWLMGHNPAIRIIAVSYSQSLSLRHASDFAIVVQSDWYRELFPKVDIKSAQRHKIVTTQNGFRFTTSIGGTITGEGADVIIIDDPHNPTFIHSDKVRTKVCEWYEQTLVTRLNNRATGVIALVMQRLHANDMTGYLLNKAQDKWAHYAIPAIAQTKQLFAIKDKIYSMEQNQEMDAKRLNINALKSIESEIGQYNYCAQFLQDPSDDLFGLLESKYIKTCTLAPTQFDYIAHSWDTAIKTNQNSDFSACTIWGVISNEYYILDSFAAKMEYAELKKTIIAFAQKWSPSFILIEDKASGQSVIQDLRKLNMNVIARKPVIDKVTRFVCVLSFFINNQVKIKVHENMHRLIDQLTSFPNTKHDDLVDSVTQMLSYNPKKNKRKLLI